MMLLFGLGLRAVLQRDALRRTVLLVVGAGLAVVAGLAAVAGPQVTARERSRAAARVVNDPSTARTLGFRATEHDYQGSRVTIAEVAALEADAPLPTGLTRLPGRGEALLSPALAERIGKDPTLRRWFPGSWSRLPREAVGSAGQLLAYVGADPSSFDRSIEVPGQGVLVDSQFARRGDSGGRAPVLGLALFCVVPALVFVAVCARVGSGIQARRTVALRMLGVSRWGAGVVAWIEIAPWAALGGLLGWAAFHSGLRVVHELPLVHRRFFAEDAAIAPSTAVFVVAVVTLVGGALSGLGALSAGKLGKTSRPALAHRPASRWTAAAGGIGLGLFALAYLRQSSGDPILTAAIVLYGVGLPSATMVIVQLLAGRWARLPVGTSVLLGLRKLEKDPGRAVRVAGVAALAVYAVCVAQPVTQVLNAGRGNWLDAAKQARPAGIMGAVDGLTTEPLQLLGQPPAGIRAILPIVDYTDDAAAGQRTPRALIASCSELQQVAKRPISGCVDAPLRLRTTTGREAVPDGTLGIVPGAIPGNADWIVPPAMAKAAGLSGHSLRGALLEVEPTLAAWQDAQAWIVASDPSYRITNFYQSNVRSSTVGLWLLLGVSTASALTLLSGAVLAFEAALLRKRELFALRAIGVSRGRLQAAQLTEGVLAGGVAIGLALIGSLGATAAYWHMLRDDPFPSLAPYGLAALAGLASIVGIAWSSSLAMSRRLSPT